MLTRYTSLFTLMAAGFGAVSCGGRASAITDGAGGAAVVGAAGAIPTGPSTTTGGGSVATGGAGGSSGECSAGIDGDSLAGNWHAIGTRIGVPPLELAISVDSQRLAIQTARGSFSAQKDGTTFTVTYMETGAPKLVAATQQIAGSMALGAIPIDLSGSWAFRNVRSLNDTTADMYGCDATLSATNVSAICSAARLPSWVRPYDLGPGSAMGTKVADGSSSFGDLSGTWSVPLRAATCTFRFEGSTFASDCGPKLGAMRITFCGSVASGTTTSGIEFSAQRL